MLTRDEWEISLKAALEKTAAVTAGIEAFNQLMQALFAAGAYDVRIIRNKLAREIETLESVRGRVLDQNGEEHEFEARRPPFAQSLRWVTA